MSIRNMRKGTGKRFGRLFEVEKTKSQSYLEIAAQKANSVVSAKGIIPEE